MLKNNSSQKVILAVGAHPDDIDIGSSGSIARWVKEGAEVHYLILTDGSKGHEDHTIPAKKLTRMRRAEQEEAAKILSLSSVHFLDFTDGELQNTPKLQKQIVKLIRTLKPTIVLCWDPTFTYDLDRGFINHPDHRVAGQATLDSVFPFARNSRTFPELLAAGLQPHSVKEVLLVNFSKQNYFVDITKTWDLKWKAISCHQSQFSDFNELKKRVEVINKKFGKKINKKYAEGFLRIRIAS